MNFIAKIVFKINTSADSTVATFDEQLRWIDAENRTEAMLLAQKIGKGEDEKISTDKNDLIHWQFIDVSELWEVSESENGRLLYSFSNAENEPADYIKFVKLRAQKLKTPALHEQARTNAQ
ncbi:MAG: DUF4288 domain-containing protein [Bacteroidia bacterium]|nr:DUF4288 domain-containing protein [Bacteroidia bacterium]